MSMVSRNLVEYYGIDSCSYENVLYFNQVNKDFTFCVPVQKPDIEQIVKVWVKPCILEQKLVKGSTGVSLEGQVANGNTLMIMGDIQYKVEYVALESTQKLHTAHTVVPFCGYIVLANKVSKSASIRASVFVEDMYSEQLDCRCIYNNLTMMLIADLY